MPKLIDVPGMGTVSFPEDMPDSEIEGVLKKHTSTGTTPAPKPDNFPKIVTTPYEKMEMARGYKTDPGDVSGDTGAAKALLQMGRHPLETAGGAFKVAGDVTRAAITDAVDTLTTHPEYGGNLYELSKGNELPVDAQYRELSQQHPALATAAKISQGVIGTAPMMVAGGAPAWAQRLLAAGFSAKMISDAPKLATELGTELGKNPKDRDRDKITSLLADAAQIGVFAPLAGSHALKSRAIELKGGPDASRIEKATEVHGDVQPQPVESKQAVPTEKGGAGVQPHAEAQKAGSEVPLSKSIPEEQLKLHEVSEVDRRLIRDANQPHPEATIDSTVKKVVEKKPGFTNEAANAIVNELRNTEDPDAVLKKWRELKESSYAGLEEAKKSGKFEDISTEGFKKQAANEALEIIKDHGERLGFSKDIVEQAKKLRETHDSERMFEEPTVESVTPLDPQSGSPKSATDMLIDKLESKPTTPEKEPEMIGMGAATPEEFPPGTREWIEQNPNIVRKTGIQSFIEKVAKSQGQTWGDMVERGISASRALKEYFRGQEKGGVAGRKAATEELKMADKWLEADANNIRQSLTELVTKSLPISERGRFVKAIADATKRPPILSGDVEGMYKRAAQVAARIEDRAHEVKKNDTIDEIKKTVEKSLASPSVDVEYKNRISQAVKRLGFKKLSADTAARLKGTREALASGAIESVPDQVVSELDLLNKVPAKDLPLHVLEAIRDRVQLMEKLGRLKVKTRQALWDAEKDDLRQGMKSSESSKLEDRPELRPQPGEKMTFSLRLKNSINRRMNAIANIDRGISPRDVLMDLLDGAKAAYNGFMSRTFSGRIDSAFNRMLVRRDELTDPVAKYGRSQKFKDTDYERIGTYAVLQQEGGRERLIENGARPEVLDNIESSIKPNEKKMYEMMRSQMDSQLSGVQSLMRNLYNIEVKPVENYFPLQRDWRQFEQKAEPKALKGQKGGDVEFDELAAWKTLEQDYLPRRTTQTEKGFTKERLPDASTPIKIHALDIFSRHIQDVSHLLETQRDLKMLGEMARGDDFLKTYGIPGQKFVLDWLDTVSRQGGTESFRRIAMLDALRRNTTLGVIGFRVASQFVHLANIPLAMNQTGPGWYFKGARAAMTKEGQAFFRKNFAETFARAGAEPAIEEAKDARLLGIPIGKAAGPAFWIVKNIDRLNSQATALAAYQRLLAEKGVNPEMYDKIPIDEQARNQALIMARRAVASPLPKDVPQALSRGAITSGNVSVGRALLQFQNAFLDQWSNARHDMVRAGIGQGDMKQAATTAAALAAMVLIETGIKKGVQTVVHGVTGYQPKKPESFEQKAVVEALRRFPFMGNLLSVMMYGETGVPAIDALVQIGKSAKTAATAKTEKSREKAAIQAISGTAQAFGVPGASQVGEIIEKSQ